MANWRSNFLKQLVGGDILKDYQHAARLYTDDLHRLQPKNQFLYHVNFNVNGFASGSALGGSEKIELGMIVKSTDLPAYQFNVELKNQYNYKNYSQTGITYQPVRIELHDDMGDVATSLFKSYYQHYIVDPNIGEGGYSRQGYGFSKAGRWGRDVAKHNKFFNSISIFQMGRKRFTEYQMMNPVVNDWSNGSMAQDAGTGLNSHTFSVSYSGVKIKNGAVGADPEGFATFHYDKTPSPNRSGGDSVFGILTGAAQSVGLLQEGNLLGAALTAAGAYEKIKNGSGIRGAEEEIIGLAKDAIKGGYNNLGATSKPGVVFPQNIRKKNTINKVKESKATRVTASTGTKFKAVGNEIVLTPAQAKKYITANTVAKTKIAKYISFKTDRNLDVNNVETEWAKLTTNEKNAYLTDAPTKAQTLSQQGILNYTVDKDTYNKILEVQ